MENANIEQKIIGTWVEGTYGQSKWVFNTNGTLTVSSYEGARVNGKYRFCVIDTKLALQRDVELLSFYDISISSDGKNLFLEEGMIASGCRTGFWLAKQ